MTLAVLGALAVPLVVTAPASATPGQDCRGAAVRTDVLTEQAGRAAGEGHGRRDAALHPFSSDSPVNTALGSGATFEGPSNSRTKAFLSGSAMINCERWSIEVVQATDKDPLATLTDVKNGGQWKIRIPSDAEPTPGTDRHLSIIQPDGRTVFEAYKVHKESDTRWTSTYVVKNDLTSDGLSRGARASGISQITGLIRAHEVTALNIPHALAMGIPNSMLKDGPVWPSRLQDSDGSRVYSGPIPMGSLIAIPPDVDVQALGLSPEGLALARALQDYGSYVLVRAGTVSFFAEPEADSEAVLRMRRDWQQKLYPLMRVVTNSSADNVGGGGERRRPPAPPIDGQPAPNRPAASPAPQPAPAPGPRPAPAPVPEPVPGPTTSPVPAPVPGPTTPPAQVPDPRATPDRSAQRAPIAPGARPTQGVVPGPGSARQTAVLGRMTAAHARVSPWLFRKLVFTRTYFMHPPQWSSAWSPQRLAWARAHTGWWPSADVDRAAQDRPSRADRLRHLLREH